MAWGYGLGSMMRVGENLFAFYFIYYLSTVVGVDPATAGAISGAALLAGALCSPVLGHLSDRSRSRYGRRRPFMIVTALPAMGLLVLLFTSVDLGEATGAYYLVVALLFSVTYYAFLVPYDALGANLTTDYNQRTTVRSICTAILYISVLVGGTLVVQVQAMLEPALTTPIAWTAAMILCCALPGGGFGILAWRMTRGRETGLFGSQVQSAGSIRSAVVILKLRPVWSVLVWGLAYFFGNALIGGTLIYLGVYVLKLPEHVASTLFIVSTASTLVAVIPGNYLAKKLGKRATIMLGMSVVAVTSIIMYFLGFDGYVAGATITAAFGICNAFALSCSYAMIYDLREVTEIRLGHDKTAVILGWFSLVIGLAGALGATTIGTVLHAVAFDPSATPSADVIGAIVSMQTWVPCSALALSAVALLFWNVDALTHAKLADEIQKIKNTEVLTEPEIESINR